jgi:hypothetical protein
VDLGPYPYSFCLMGVSGDAVFSSACDTLCNPFLFTEGCCKQYLIRNDNLSLEVLYYYDCCTGDQLSDSLEPNNQTVVCSRSLPLTGMTLQYLSCCDCSNRPEGFGGGCSP